MINSVEQIISIVWFFWINPTHKMHSYRVYKTTYQKKKWLQHEKKAEFWIIDESSGIGWFNLISLKPSLENPETINQPNEI